MTMTEDEIAELAWSMIAALDWSIPDDLDWTLPADAFDLIDHAGGGGSTSLK